MIKNFKQYNESIRDKMEGVPTEEVKKKIDEILSGDNEDITSKIYDFFVKIYNDYSYADVYEDITFSFDPDFTRKTILKLIKEKMDDGYYKKASEVQKDDTEEFLTEIYDILYYQDDYMYMELIEDLINEYDPEEFKKIAKNMLKKELKLNDWL